MESELRKEPFAYGLPCLETGCARLSYIIIRVIEMPCLEEHRMRRRRTRPLCNEALEADFDVICLDRQTALE